MSILKCNRLENTSTSSGGLDVDTSGKVRITTLADSAGNTLNITRQVLQAVKTDTFSSSSETFTDVTGLSVAITPTSSSSKILIKYGGCMGINNNRMAHVRLVRDSTTDIFVGDQGESSQARASSSVGTEQTYYQEPFGGEFLDSPSTTSAITYKLQIASGDSNNTIYVGRSDDNSNEFSRSRTPSFITVMEVAA